MADLKIFGTLPDSWLFSNFYEFLFRSTLWMCVPKFKVNSFNRSWDNRDRAIQKCWEISDYAHAFLSPTVFNGLLFGWTLSIYLPNLKTAAVQVPEIIGVAKKIGQSLATPTLPIPPPPQKKSYRPSIYVHSVSRNFRLEFWVGAELVMDWIQFIHPSNPIWIGLDWVGRLSPLFVTLFGITNAAADTTETAECISLFL